MAKTGIVHERVGIVITREDAPRTPITIDWATNEVFAAEGGWTRQIATFTTEQYQIDRPVMEAT